MQQGQFWAIWHLKEKRFLDDFIKIISNESGEIIQSAQRLSYAFCSNCGNKVFYKHSLIVENIFKCPRCGYVGYIKNVNGRMMLEK